MDLAAEVAGTGVLQHTTRQRVDMSVLELPTLQSKARRPERQLPVWHNGGLLSAEGHDGLRGPLLCRCMTTMSAFALLCRNTTTLRSQAGISIRDQCAQVRPISFDLVKQLNRPWSHAELSMFVLSEG